MDNTKTTSDRESERRYQHQFEASRKAEKRAIQLLDFVPYPMVVFKLDGKVSFVNSAFTEMFGWTLGELAGRHIPYFYPGVDKKIGYITRNMLEVPWHIPPKGHLTLMPAAKGRTFCV